MQRAGVEGDEAGVQEVRAARAMRRESFTTPLPPTSPPPPPILASPTADDGPRRYASLYFVACIDMNFNELITLEIIHMFVETLDRYFGNVCELDIMCVCVAPLRPHPPRATARPFIDSHVLCLAMPADGCAVDHRFNFHKAYYLLDELVMGGELQETNKKEVLDIMAQQEDSVVSEGALGGKKKGGGDAYSDL